MAWGCTCRARGPLLASIPLLTQDYRHGLQIGYFAWLASMILLIIVGLAGRMGRAGARAKEVAMAQSWDD